MATYKTFLLTVATEGDVDTNELAQALEDGLEFVRQRAEHLLAKGVEAKLDIDPEATAPGYAAHAIGVGKLPCGYHASEQDAIEAGTAWLRHRPLC